MSKNLVIVESPAKGKTISKFLGPDYIVEASFGHVRDLPKSGMSIDIAGGFIPDYEISPDKKKRIAELKKIAKSVDTVYLASDEDREGEAISWHLCQALGLDPKTTKRIVFHEITETAIKHALATPRVVDQNLVDAQQARRVLDRLVGYELSPVLWKKVQRGLSAGRVQSVAVRLIVDREREIEAFDAKSSFRVTAEFPAENATVKAELARRFPTDQEARGFLEDCTTAHFSVADLSTKPAKRSPSAPFTTSTLQQEAARKLGFSVRQTMSVAQRLYEQGHITYMRTDSVNLSSLAIGAAADTIKREFGDRYHQVRTFTTKSAGAQEAHEAIRPTRFDVQNLGPMVERNEQRLYELIWKRTVASQMAEAQLERTTAEIAISTRPEHLQAKGEVVVFDGFLKLYLVSRDEDDEGAAEEGILPPLQVGQLLQLGVMNATQVFDRPKPRYSEAALVKRLEEMGIGRPSTYAPTISTIQDRQYVEKADLEGKTRQIQTFVLKPDSAVTEARLTENYGADRGKLIPTPTGMVVTDFLVQHFPAIVDFHFTRSVEEEFDGIADGNKTWNTMISEFYGPFHKSVTDTEGIERPARQLGTDPKTGKPVSVRLGQYGPMVQIGTKDDEDKPRFASVPAGTSMEALTFEEAMALFNLPRVIGTTEAGEEISANNGRFGPYIKWGSTYASIKPDDPFSITLERAQELIAEKIAADANKYVKQFEKEGISIVNGRYGPYITDGKKNAKIPKDQDPAKLELADCVALLEAAPVRAKRRRIVKK